MGRNHNPFGGGKAPARDERLRSLRDEWFTRLELPGKEKILFELETLLKGLDRFFNLANLPLTDMEHAIALNFVEETEIVLAFIERVTDLAGELLQASRRGDYQFEFYVGSRLMGDYERTRWRELVLEQRRPEDSLFILYISFLNFKDIIKGLAQLKRVPYTVFANLGSLVTREIIANRFFSPLKQLEFRVEYDRIDNKQIRDVIRAIKDPELARQASVVILAFNRLLQYLLFVNPKGQSMEELKNSLLFFALIHSETKYLMEFMERGLPERFAGQDAPRIKAFLATCDSLSFQLQMELKKIHTNELMNLSKQRSFQSVKIAVENSHGILKNFFQQSVVQLLQDFSPGVSGDEVYPTFVSRRIEGVRLREDLAVLQALMDRYEEITETTEAGGRVETYLTYLALQKAWVRKMRADTIKFMRHHDLVEFDKYFKLVEQFSSDDLHLSDQFDKFKMESKFFKILVETTLGHIQNRVDLQGVPLDQGRVRQRFETFLAQSAEPGPAARPGA